MKGAQLDKPLDGRAILDAAAVMSQAGVDNDVIEHALGQVRSYLIGPGAIGCESVVAPHPIGIGLQMVDAGLPYAFVLAATQLGLKSKPVQALMTMWAEEGEQAERDAIIADLQELIDDYAPKPEPRPEPRSIKLTDLDAIAENVQAFKDRLRLVVESKGGIKKLAEMTKIPQPSLSRFFNSGAMPRRTTLLKIQQALGLDQIDLDARWMV